MSEHPIMAMLIGNSSFVGNSEDIDNEIMPLDSQLALQPGDKAMAAAANTMLESQLMVMEILDPAQHASTYPDWEVRLLNSYLLCRYTSLDEVGWGWFSRVKLLPITDEQYEEVVSWKEDPSALPEKLPDWISEGWEQFTEQLADRAPTRVPKPVVCANCGSNDVELVITRKITYRGRAGTLTIDEREIVIPVVEIDPDSHHVARLQCVECDSIADLDDDDWELPGATRS